MKVKLSKVGSDAVFKLVLDGSPSDVAELHRMGCEKFDVQPEDYNLQYLDPDFKDYINLTDVSDVCDLMSLRLCPKSRTKSHKMLAACGTRCSYANMQGNVILTVCCLTVTGILSIMI